jgi:hypothetical protein
LVHCPDPSRDEHALTDCAADLLNGWGIDTTVNEEVPWVMGHLAGTGPRVAFVSYMDDMRLLFTEVAENEVSTFADSPLDSRIGAAMMLSLARRFAVLPPDERPDLYFVGWPREEQPESSMRLAIPAIDEAETVIVLDDPASTVQQSLGHGPVVVWDEDTTPEWVLEVVEGDSQLAEQLIQAEIPSDFTTATDDSGPNMPALLVGPTIRLEYCLGTHVSVADIEGSERLLIDLLKDAASEEKYSAAFHKGSRALFADPTQFHDPHGLMTLGLLRAQLVEAFGQKQVDDWMEHALAETCLVRTEDAWAGGFVLQPDMPALPSCGGDPSLHFTSELILALAWNDLEEIRRPDGEDGEVVITRDELVHWLQRHIAVDEWSPGMAAQALVVGGVPLTTTWQTVDGDTWSLDLLLQADVERWRASRDAADLKPGDLVPENMLHLGPALISLLRRDPDTIPTYGLILDEVFDVYRNALSADGYWGFPGETVSTGHMVEQYLEAQSAGVNVALPSLRPVELMVEHQDPEGWFDIHNSSFIGAQAHGVRALGAVLPLME